MVFTPEKFILGLNSLEISETTKKLRRLFKVYEPIFDKTMYECEVLQRVCEVTSG